MLQGSVEHGDSMGNHGIIHSGDVQWMTAGSGIIHQGMPQKQNGTLWGFQLWVNLPSSYKMMSPRYRDVPGEQIPEVLVEGDLRIKVISGQLGDIRGPVRDLVADVTYLDVAIPADREYVHPVSRGNRIFAYVIQGEGDFGSAEARPIPAEHLVIFGDGDQVRVKTEADPVRFLLISGPPLGEPIAWRGPIVMNTPEELDLAFQEYREGTFIKHGI
jgi:redox-sensitive bicupin YhaK (pirin superfamily)